MFIFVETDDLGGRRALVLSEIKGLKNHHGIFRDSFLKVAAALLAFGPAPL
jgi:hypothetical protein